MRITGSPRYQCAHWYHPPHKCGGRGRLRRQLYKFQIVVLLNESDKHYILYLTACYHLTDFAYSVGVMPNFSLNCREKWCTVEYCSTAAISVKFRLFSRIICVLS